MSILHAIVLGILQGLTEFLPISSSGHLTLAPRLLEWNDHLTESQYKTFEVALHAGTLIGAVAYLRDDVIKIISSSFGALRKRQLDTYSKLGILLIVSSIPGAALGAALDDMIANNFGETFLIATMLIAFGIILFICDRSTGIRGEEDFHVRDAILAGISQAVALIPGVSRSGVTMSMLRARGFSREASARLSFLMLVPIVAGAALYTGSKTLASDGIPSGLGLPMLVGFIVSAIVGYLAVFGLLRFVRTRSFNGFVIYRIIAGAGVFVWLIVK